MSDPKNPVPGDKHIDASELSLVDVTPEAMQKFVKVRDGIDKAVASLKRLDSGQIERAGLNAGDVARAIAIAEQHGKIDVMIPAAEKLAEMLVETRAARGHELGTLIGEIAWQARRRGERDPKGPEILGPLADLFAYQYGPAQKSAATRAKTSAKEETAGGQEEVTTG
jgi:predicted nucleic acid-binding protein